MLKRIGWTILLCALLLTAAAETAPAYTAPEPGAPLALETDLGLLVDGVWYPILNDFAPLLAALGEPTDLVAAPSCVFKGEDKEFVYDGMSVYTNPLGEIDVWYEAYITGADFRTARGIGIGAALEDVLAAYGENYYLEGEDMLTYSLSGDPEDYASPCLVFTLTGGAVSCIDIYYPTNTL